MVASVDVDHVIRAEVYIALHDGNEVWFYDLDNLRGGCHPCHAHKTALENRGLWQESMVGSGLVPRWR
jgi:5-methylcytosine-specific restriction endonuclease McrA